jgi:hypothetical protein
VNTEEISKFVDEIVDPISEDMQKKYSLGDMGIAAIDVAKCFSCIVIEELQKVLLNNIKELSDKTDNINQDNLDGCGKDTLLGRLQAFDMVKDILK